MKPSELNQQPDKSYSFGEAAAIVDGLSGNKGNYKDGSWIGFNRGALEIFIDFKRETDFSEVSFNTYVCTGDWIFGAKELDIAISDDGESYKPIAVKSFPDPTGHVEEVKENKINFDSVKARYIKVSIKKENKIPNWHGGAGKPAFIFIDEIKIK